MFFFFVEGFIAVLVVAFLCYALLEARSARKGSAQNATLQFEKRTAPLPDWNSSSAECFPDTLPGTDGKPWPFVSVLLPVCNEQFVVKRLLQSVCALRYPKTRFEILILDDSTDDTFQIIENVLPKFQEQGLVLQHLRRSTRTGYKAGNLSFGLAKAQGEFLAIFDADCRPPADFLLKTIPCFADEKVGFLQTAISYVNASTTFLTRFQAMEAGHKDDVTTGLSLDGRMASLTGSSCVWRRSCIEAIGGISAATITEDVDMGYAAQLKDWRYVWLGNVTSQAEFPETIAAFRVQRQRWARGLIQNARRHVRKVFASPMSLLSRLYAVSLMCSSLLLATFYAVLLLCLPVTLLQPEFGTGFHIICSFFVLAACVWGWSNSSWARTDSIVQHACKAFFYILMHFPISLYYFTAALQVASHTDTKTGFYRTPKGSGRKKIAQPRMNTLLLSLEVFSCLYAIVCLGISLSFGHYWVSLYSGLCTAGFAMSLFFSWSDSHKTDLPSRILITGASGALGAALAEEYAAPGRHLLLHGRNAEALQQVADTCRAKGALVETHVLDLSSPDSVHVWMTELCTRHVPDLVIANAGRNTNVGEDCAGEPFTEAVALVQVNLLSTMALFDAVLPFYRSQGRGQFAIISSLAAYYGLAMTPTYCATKAALKSYGTSLRAWLHKENIHVSTIFPGYVASRMCSAMPGPKPFLMTPQKAARRIRRGLERNRARISFPFPLNLGVWGLGLLPVCLAMPVARLLGYGRRS